MNPPIEPDASAPSEDALNDLLGRLAPLYHDGEGDRPDNVLADHPDTASVIKALKLLVDVIKPGRFYQGDIGRDGLEPFLRRRVQQAWMLLLPELTKAIPFRWKGEAARCEGIETKCDPAEEAERVLSVFVDRLPEIRSLVVDDVRAAYEGDPAALSYAVVQMSYPGVLAIVTHRIAHEFYKLCVPLIPRIMSEWAHSRTGADIHPGAKIGRAFFIDHATGVVIGETAQLGERVKIYQGVTLGAKNFPLDEQGRPIKHIKRHPTVENGVVIYANAIILGGDTVIGACSTIGGNVFLMKSVPANSFVTNKLPELRIKQGDEGWVSP